MIIRYLALFLFLVVWINPSSAVDDNGCRISVEINGFEGDAIYLAYYYGDKQYIRDTTEIGVDGKFVFQEMDIEPGVYLVVLPPDNKYMEILINGQDKELDIYTDLKDLVENCVVKGSKDNELYFDYLRFIGGMKERVGEINEGLENTSSATEKQKLTAERNKIDEEVKAYQQQLISSYPEMLIAALIKSGFDPIIPEYEGTEEEVQMKRYLYVKKHFFDNIDLADNRLLRTPVMFNKVNYYIEKLTYQIPDSLNKEIDFILKQMIPSEENFQFYTVHFLNKYAKSKIMGMDAVYVHLVENYYASGLATWSNEEDMAKIVKRGKALKPILIGKVAPDLTLQNQNGVKLNIHSIQSEYILLFFWDPECGHCKKETPKLIEFYEEYSSKGVEVVAVCTKVTDGVGACWKAIEEKGMVQWINLVDPFIKSRYKTIYDITSTPKLFLLDKDKKIVAKSIGAEQLPEVMDQLIGTK